MFPRGVYRAELPAGAQAHGDPAVHEIRRPAQLPAPLSAGNGSPGREHWEQRSGVGLRWEGNPSLQLLRACGSMNGTV